MKKRFPRTLILSLTISILTACGGGGGITPGNCIPSVIPISGEHVYVTSSAAGTLTGFNLDVNGSLLNSTQPVLSGGGGANQVILDAVHNRIFVANATSASISTFNVSDTATNAIALSSTFSIPNSQRISAMALDPAGKFLYVTDAISGLYALEVNSTSGNLSLISSFVTQGSQPGSVLVHPSGQYVYVGTRGGPSVIDAYSVNAATGALTELPGAPFDAGGKGVVALAADSAGAFLFAADQSSNTISVFNVETSTGFLSPVAGTPFSTAPLPSALALANGFLYTLHPNSQQLGIYEIGADGALKEIQLTTLSTLAQPTSMAVDPNSKFLLISDASAGRVLVNSLDASTGEATLVAPFDVSGGANGLAVGTFQESSTQPCVIRGT